MTIYNRESTHQFWSTSHVQVFILQNVDNCTYSLARVRQNMCTSLEWVRNSNLFTKPMWSCGVSYEQPPHDGSIVSPFTFLFRLYWYTSANRCRHSSTDYELQRCSYDKLCCSLLWSSSLLTWAKQHCPGGGKQSVNEPRLLTAKSKTLLLQTLNCDLTSDI